MSEALTYFYQIYSGFLDLVFDQIQIVNGVYLGWVLIAIFVFRILIRNIMAVPRSAKSITLGRKKDDE